MVVSVPYGDLFCFYLRIQNHEKRDRDVSVPYGDLFCFYEKNMLILKGFKESFRPLWGSFLFLFLDDNCVRYIVLVSVPYGDLFCFYPVLWKPYRA